MRFVADEWTVIDTETGRSHNTQSHVIALLVAILLNEGTHIWLAQLLLQPFDREPPEAAKENP